MEKWLKRCGIVVVAGALALGASACGGDEKKGGGETKAPAAGQAKQGGEATLALTSQPDYLDPALSYTVEGWQTLWITYTPLLTYPHVEGAEGAKLIPGLAKALPEISADGKVYKFELRPDLKYSDGTPVKASDFERTIQRVLNLESGGSAFFFAIEGAEEYVKGKQATADIPGIEADDATRTITIALAKPDASFSHVLAMPFAALVPGDTPFKDLSKTPPPGVGAYKITSSVPNRQHVLERNANFPEIEGVPKGNLDKITIKIIKNQQRQTQDVLANKLDSLADPPPPDLLRRVKAEAADRYREVVTNSTYYFFLNTRVAPFDNKLVRQAVNFALDKPGLARLFGGLLEPGCNFLPPGMSGYVKIDPCPYGDPSAPPNLERARALIKEAGAEGAEVTVYGNDEDPTKRVAEALADMLTQVGLKAKPKIVEASVYFQTIGNQKTKAQVGFANWFQDFPHPKNFMFLVDGKSIQDTNNQNFGNVNDAVVDDEIEALEGEADLEAVADRWAALDRRLVDEALIAPYGHRKLTMFMSERMDFENCAVFHPVNNQDYSSMCLK